MTENLELGERVIPLLAFKDEKLIETLKKTQVESDIITILNDAEKEIDFKINELQQQVKSQELLEQLHQYNFLKDCGQEVIGSLAAFLGVTVASLHHQILDDGF